MVGITPVFADSDFSSTPIQPMDGFSYSYSSSDPAPSGSGGYGRFGTAKSGDKRFENALGSMLVTEISAGLLTILHVPALASQLASFILNSGNSYLLSSPYIYYSVSTAYHNTLPGFYQKQLFKWYADAAHTMYITTTIVYKFKA